MDALGGAEAIARDGERRSRSASSAPRRHRPHHAVPRLGRGRLHHRADHRGRRRLDSAGEPGGARGLLPGQ